MRQECGNGKTFVEGVRRRKKIEIVNNKTHRASLNFIALDISPILYHESC